MENAQLAALSLAEYLNRLAGGDPTPGGGSAAALAGALGASLASMVCNLTLGREKFAHLEQEVRAWLARAEALRARLQAGVDADSLAYGEVMVAYGLPRGSEAEKARRSEAIQTATREAARVPLDVANDCAALLTLCDELVGRTNPHAASDVAVAALLAGAGLEGAAANVEINLRSIKDERFVRETRDRLTDLRAQRETRAASVLSRSRDQISG